MRRAFCALVLALVAVPSATAALKPLHVTITGQSHHPVVGKPWHYAVKVTTAAGASVACRIHLQMLFSGSPVGEIGIHVVKNGIWQETFPAKGPDAFPPTARGEPLVLQATVTAKGYRTTKAGWSIVVR